MKTRIKKIFQVICLALLGSALCGPAATQAAGILKPARGDAQSVRMKSHHVDVTINNGFARTEVDQIFINTGERDLEAVYSFPVPKDASLSELSLWIDGREVMGEVLEKEQARAVYQDQTARGKEAAIAEKNRYETFDVAVSPVRARKETRIRLVYYQPLEMDLNIGRYVYPLESGNVNEEQIRFWQVDESVKENLSFNLTLKSAFPVKDVRMPGYDGQAVVMEKSGDESASGEAYSVSLDFPDGGRLSKDIVFYYRLEDNAPARVELIPYRRGEGQGTFMLVVTPGGALQPIRRGTDWTFVLDVSGSMSGAKIATLASGVAKTIRQMSPEDRFRIVTFSNRAHDFSNGFLAATEQNIEKMIHNVAHLKTGGSTALFAGMELAYQGLDDDRINGIILVTDGVANDGPSDDIDILALHRKHDIRLFTFVIGNSANQPLLDRLATESGGFSMNISNSDDIIGRILQAKAKLIHECLYDTTLTFSGAPVTGLSPETIGSLYKGQQVVMFGRYEAPGEVTIELSGRIDGKPRSWSCSADLPALDTDNPEIERLWALSSIKDIENDIGNDGERAPLVDEIIHMGTTYSLVTDYTAMVVADEQEMEALEIDRKNARRVHEERSAQAARKDAPVKNYRVDSPVPRPQADASPRPDGGMFKNHRSSGVGSGPVGPLFVGLAYWMSRRKKKHQ